MFPPSCQETAYCISHMQCCDLKKSMAAQSQHGPECVNQHSFTVLFEWEQHNLNLYQHDIVWAW